MPTTWQDLKTSVQTTGRCSTSLIMRLALIETRREIAACKAAGIRRTFREEIAYQLTLAWQRAKTYRDQAAHAKYLATVSPAERAARQLELRAELLETAIPPHTAEAADLRAQAQVCRQASYLRLAAE